MKNETATNSVFINGRNQIIEMLQHMTPQEKGRILKLIRIKNPILADELQSKSFSFHDLVNLSTQDITKLANSIKPAIFGMALKGLDVKMQKKFLSILPRDYAEAAYGTMTTFYNNEKDLGARAKNKILETFQKVFYTGKII